ncbi:hypothetical protein [Pengzhenrongella sp.]|jgi:hypothetical protein|uniref:hypothetical protein n=1 Tax=Pengzhenrongella sp. TaxID=2888820 RepID=UPI002F947F72
MAAKVRINASDYKNYEDGDVITVNDGHLEVLGRWNGSANPTIAVYAPGQWRSAVTKFDKA